MVTSISWLQSATAWIDFWFVKVVPKYLKYSTLQRRGKSPNIGRCIISYQEVLHSLLKNVNHQADETVLCNHSINGQLLRTSVLTGHLCFGALWYFCLLLNCDSWAVEGKLFFWISLVLSSLLSVILNTCFGLLVEFLSCFIQPFSPVPVCAYYGEVWWA